MSRIGLSDLYAYDNLYLAWKRIQTSTNSDYKQLNLEAYGSFGWNNEEKIRLVSEEIEAKIYAPSKSSKYYLPKPSGLVRPITVLSVKDQIFYQAIANLVCKAQINNIKYFRSSCVFGGFNIDKPDSIHFLSHWMNEYKSYKSAIRDSYTKGYKWICKFDLASFYDVIDHHILAELALQKSFDEDVKELFTQCLDQWCKPGKIDFKYSQGIPQGPSASQVFADIYLYHLDEKIQRISPKLDLVHFRYVDDIFLMAKSHESIQKGLVNLDIIARELALVPQSGKIEIRNPDDISSVLKGENSLINLHSSLKESNDQDILNDLLHSSYKEDDKTGEIQIIDETSLKYTLYRLEPIDVAKRLVLRILKKHHSLVDVCIYYLNKFDDHKDVADTLIDVLNSGSIYDWCAAKILEQKAFEDIDNINRVIPFGFSSLNDPEIHWILKRSILKVVEKSPRTHLGITHILRENICESNIENQLPYYVSLLSASFEFLPETVISFFDELYAQGYKVCDELNLVFGCLMAVNGRELQSHHLHNEWISRSYSLKSYLQLDGLSAYFVDFFGLPKEYKNKVDFKVFLGAEEYEAALECAVKSKGYYDSDPELFVLQSDSLHQIILSRIFCSSNEEKLKYEMGNLVGKTKSTISFSYPGLCFCHERRSDSSKAHAFNMQKKQINSNSKGDWYRIRDELAKMLPVTYRYLIDYIEEKQNP